MPALLIAMAGLPGAGKSTVARELALRLDAVYLRIDSIEQALCESARLPDGLDDAGYRVAYSVAEDNLRLGRTVIADCVNPLAITRDAWLAVAARAEAAALEIEVICSDRSEHRRRVDSRGTPTWEEVEAREYHPWVRERVVIDTAFFEWRGGSAWARGSAPL